jgi:nucleoid-associated protein YgaU
MLPCGKRPPLLPWAVFCLCLLLSASGCRRHPLSNERDPYYRRGVKLLQDHKYEKAADAFQKALRHNPNSVKAHLQLGMLYADRFDDPLSALYHYRLYLRDAPGSKNAATVRRWKRRVEEKLRQQLEASRTPAAAAPRPAGKKSVRRGASGVTDRERGLAKHIKELHTRVLFLEQQLEQCRRQTRAAKPTGQKTQPAPTGGNAGNAPAATAGNATATQTTPAADTGGQQHVVRRGETLSSLARKYYGSGKYWPALRNANQNILKGSEILHPGMVLRIPPRKELTP